ncbi:MAG: DUF5103 domain-containing protein [Rubricoccaceae bacterium]|nr:DUF5103 domain-containing protein [Rubricoccaceae bacterium]
MIPMYRNPALFLMFALLSGCATTEEMDGGERPSVTLARHESGGSMSGFGLVRTADHVKAVQLYPTADEEALPFLSMGTGQTLTLSFDIIDEGTGSPLSVYFYHADKTWRRDLVPAEYLTSFLSDDIRNYEPSSSTELRYVHYTYEFPNTNIDFRVSGNYVVRVSEQGYEDDPLFERAFFVSEDAAEIEFTFRSGLSPNGSLLQPIARVRPGSRLDGVQAFDFSACFARNGRFESANCTQDPSLLDLALYQFELPRQASFPPEEPYYEINLGLLQINQQVLGVDLSTSPFRANLDLDYARFGSEVDRGALTGQPVISDVYLDGGRAETQAEYVDVHFRFVPEGEQPLSRPVILSGAFNNWQTDRAYALDWNASEGYYENTFLIKQGMYLYRYYTEDIAAAQRRAVVNQPTIFTALIYVFDSTLHTDRLVSFRTALAR